MVSFFYTPRINFVYPSYMYTLFLKMIYLGVYHVDYQFFSIPISFPQFSFSLDISVSLWKCSIFIQFLLYFSSSHYYLCISFSYILSDFKEKSSFLRKKSHFASFLRKNTILLEKIALFEVCQLNYREDYKNITDKSYFV